MPRALSKAEITLSRYYADNVDEYCAFSTFFPPNRGRRLRAAILRYRNILCRTSRRMMSLTKVSISGSSTEAPAATRSAITS